MAARHGSPLVLGVGNDEYFIASDASPIVEHTRNVIYLDEGEIVTIDDNGYSIRSMHDDIIVNRETTEIEYSIEEIEKESFLILCSKKSTNSNSQLKIQCGVG